MPGVGRGWSTSRTRPASFPESSLQGGVRTVACRVDVAAFLSLDDGGGEVGQPLVYGRNVASADRQVEAIRWALPVKVPMPGR